MSEKKKVTEQMCVEGLQMALESIQIKMKRDAGTNTSEDDIRWLEIGFWLEESKQFIKDNDIEKDAGII